jgi:prephenate dehydrogenase
MRMHAIDVAADDLVVLAEADIVVLAAPVRQNIELLRELDENIRQPAIITDTGSTKREIVSAARALPPRLTFIGGHPLAGAAQGGLEHARPDLFAGRPWLLTPAFARVDSTRASAWPAGVEAAGYEASEALETLTLFVQALGAEPRVVGAEAHDRLLAFLSHLPQLTASALMQVIGEAVGQEGLGLAGRGLGDTTRLASSPDDIWKDIAATNADQIGPALDALIEVLQALRGDLSEGDRLSEVFTDARRWRERLKKGQP